MEEGGRCLMVNYWSDALRNDRYGPIPRKVPSNDGPGRQQHVKEVIAYFELLDEHGGPEAPECQEYASLHQDRLHSLAYMAEIWEGQMDCPECRPYLSERQSGGSSYKGNRKV